MQVKLNKETAMLLIDAGKEDSSLCVNLKKVKSLSIEPLNTIYTNFRFTLGGELNSHTEEIFVVNHSKIEETIQEINEFFLNLKS